MCQCQSKKLQSQSMLFISIIVVILCSLSAYAISDFANNTQLGLLAGKEDLGMYKILFQVSNITSLFIPIGICGFLCSTAKIMLTDFFDEKISLSLLFSIIGMAMIPLLLDDYFLWGNLIYYVSSEDVKSVKDFIDIEYFAGLKIADFQILNSICWGVAYLIIIIGLVVNKISYSKAFVSVILPTLILIVTYKILSNIISVR